MTATKKRKRIWYVAAFLTPILLVIIALQSYTVRKEITTLARLTRGDSSFHELRFVDEPDKQSVRFYSDSLELIGDLYLQNESASKPLIFLLHGASRQGRQLPLIRILAARFHDAGFNVFNMDILGFGASQDPAASDKFDFSRGVSAGLSHLAQTVEFDSSRVYLFGHSFGAGVSLKIIENDPRFRKVVLFGPPRRLQQRVLDDNAPDRDYFLKLWQSDMALTYPLPFDEWKTVVEELDIANYLPAMIRHGSVLLIDSEDEDPLELDFMRDIARELGDPVDYWTMPGTHHYLNSQRFLGRLTSNRRIVDTFMDQVTYWLQEGRLRKKED